MYDQLSRHEIPWTDQSVKDALTEMAKIVGDADNIAGGTQGRAPERLPDLGEQRLRRDASRSGHGHRGDFVPGVVESPLEPESGFNVFPFPAINDSPPSVVGGGDLAIMFEDTPAARAFIEYLAEAAGSGPVGRVLVGEPERRSGRLSGSDHRDHRKRDREAEEFRFDLSDLQPSEFGSTEGQGIWKLFQDFVANPDDVDGIAQQLEAAAAAAYGE